MSNFSQAGAAAQKIPLYQHYANLAGNTQLSLPVPSFNVINGGSHAGNRLAFQEFMILPVGAGSFTEAMIMGCEVCSIFRSTKSYIFLKDIDYNIIYYFVNSYSQCICIQR